MKEQKLIDADNLKETWDASKTMIDNVEAQPTVNPVRGNTMIKAWQIEEPYEGNATIVFAETRNKAKYLAVQYDEILQEYGYAEVRAIRMPQLDRYAGDKPYVMDFEIDEDRLIMVRDAGFRCLEPDYDNCEKCVAKDYCSEYQDYLENREVTE